MSIFHHPAKGAAVLTFFVTLIIFGNVSPVDAAVTFLQTEDNAQRTTGNGTGFAAMNIFGSTHPSLSVKTILFRMDNRGQGLTCPMFTAGNQQAFHLDQDTDWNHYHNSYPYPSSCIQTNNGSVDGGGYFSDTQFALTWASAFSIGSNEEWSLWSNSSIPGRGLYGADYDKLGNGSYLQSLANGSTWTDLVQPWVVMCDSDDCGAPLASFYYGKIKGTASGYARLRSGPGTGYSEIKTLPEDWIVYVASTTNSVGSTTTANGYNWYQVTDPTDNVNGWMAGSDASSTTFYLSKVREEQATLLQDSSNFLATSTDRADVIEEAIDHYYNNASTSYSLYSSDDGSNSISDIKDGGFVEKIILGIAAREDGPSFNNENVSFDYGHGIMQITPYELLANEQTSDWSNNLPGNDNRGIASHITIAPCLSTNSNLYTNCYVYGGDYDTNPSHHKDYIPYAGIGANPTYKYYSNAPQSIYANIKDGMKVLSDKMNIGFISSITTSTTTAGLTFSASDRKTILATAYYNGDCGYVDDVASVAEDIDTYFPNATSSDIADLTHKMHVVGANSICADLHSPAEVTIQNVKDGRNEGVIDGKEHNDFTFGVVDKDQKFAKILDAGNPDDYVYKIVGTDHGTYGLDIIVRKDGRSTEFNARSIPTEVGRSHIYSINTKALIEGRNDAVTIKVDTDGKGTYKTIQTGKSLTLDDFIAKLTQQPVDTTNDLSTTTVSDLPSLSESPAIPEPATASSTTSSSLGDDTSQSISINQVI